MMSGRVYNFKGAKTDAVSSCTWTSDGSLGSEERLAQQLLPGILDDITLRFVTPKLPWNTFYVLSSVSQGWKRAIRSGQVYDARVRADGAETLAVIDCIMIDDGIRPGETCSLALYSGKDKLVHKLPPIPNLRSGIPRASKCISVDGKIYVIGGVLERDDGEEGDFPKSCGDVYVLDLARQRPWKKCESMGYARIEFGLGVVGRKIYVLGGISCYGEQAVTVSEVYDPLYNTWHPFESMINWRSGHRVSTIGEELFIYGGCFLPPSESSFSSDDDAAYFLEIYHPGSNSSRKLTFCGERSRKSVFVHDGRLHLVTWYAIYVYNLDEKSWTSRHSFSHAGSSSSAPVPGCRRPVGVPDTECRVLGRGSAVVAGNELVTIEVFRTEDGLDTRRALLCSIGFGTQEETIQWQKVECSFAILWPAKLFSLQL